ncbi:MAG: DUF4214 domain-containing protein, partial [Clostridia bacterium]|nr:DUF4214 domain-containing protein [Clostridia bacterium]
MSDMFYGCSSLNELDLSSFNTSNVTNMRDMFSDCSSLSELDLSSFDTSNVTNMSDMFYGCSSLNELDLSAFNTNNVTNVDFMFANSTKLSKIYVNNNCNMSEATCWRTFNNCISLIGGNGTKYDSSHVHGSYAVIDTSDYPGYFTMKKCEVTFSSGSGATGTAPEAQSYEAYSEILLPENTFTYTGYKFAGWSDGNNTYQPIDKYSLNNKDVTFTAVWQANPTPTAQPTPVPTVVVTTTPTPSPVVPTTTVSPTSVPTVAPSTPAPTVAPELNVGDFVNRCYSVALGRDADSEGYKYWVDNLNNGAACGAQVGYGFIFSAEYINKNRSNEDFVKDLYSMYFDREPDEGGYNYWMDMLEDGVSRETVFAGFANSLEFYNLCTKYGVTQGLYFEGVDNTQQGGINCFVARLYKVCFNRLPDMAGQNGWVLKLYNGEVTGTSCSYGFVFSPEFIGKNPSNEEFVNYMYQAFFGREADEAGFNAWVKVLNDGGSYEDVFNGFTGSAEFFNLCASYQIIP